MKAPRYQRPQSTGMHVLQLALAPEDDPDIRFLPEKGFTETGGRREYHPTGEGDVDNNIRQALEF